MTSLNTGIDYCKFARNSKVILIDQDLKEHDKKVLNTLKKLRQILKIYCKKLINLKSEKQIKTGLNLSKVERKFKKLNNFSLSNK